MAGVSSRPFGTLPDGRTVTEYTLDAGGPVTLSALDLGGIVTGLHCPDRTGRRANVALGLAHLHDHLQRNRNFGTLVGRFANRIAGGRFTLDGRLHQLPLNDGPNTLHGGPDGFGARLWQATPAADGSAALDLALTSVDGDQGFPGTLQVRVRYTLTPAGAWRIDYHATTDRPTLVHLTHHVYWNLAGSGSAMGQRLTLPCSRYAPVDEARIPTGLEAVDGTPFDFRAGALLDERLRPPHLQIQRGRGIDHFFVIDRNAPGLVPAARLEDPASGRVLSIQTTEPGLQVYTGNFLDGTLQGTQGMLRQGDGVCLETGRAPDSPNRPEWPSTVLRPGEVFAGSTVHRLGLLS